MARLPRTELAAKVGISPAAITQLERGLIRPTTMVAAQLALALGVPGSFLLHPSSPEPIPASVRALITDTVPAPKLAT